MQPEIGDKSILVTRENVARAAREVGVIPGDTLMFHSSLSSMGTVVGGPDTVIDGFLDAVGPTGTVAVPTLCRWPEGQQHLALSQWDPETTPSYVGLLTEALRKRPEAVRSNHPTHSVAAIGARAVELTANHGRSGLRPGPFTPQAFAVESPWERFRQWNAAYCFIGVTFWYNTMVHYVEAVLAENALLRMPEAKREAMSEKLSGWMKPGVYSGIRIEDRLVIQDMLAAEGIVRTGKIGSATLLCARAKPMVERWVQIIEADAARWMSAEFMDWVAEGMS